MYFFQKIPLFESLSEEEIGKIADIAIKMCFRSGKMLFKEGDPGDLLYVIESGSVKIFQTRGDREKIITVFREGDCFGELSLIDGDTRSANAQALQNVSAWVIGRERFMSLMENHFTICHKIMEQLCRRLRATNQHVADLIFLEAQGKILKTLINMANKYGQRVGGKVRVDTRLPMDELGKLTGLSKEIVAMVLKNMEKRNIVHIRDQMIYLNITT